MRVRVRASSLARTETSNHNPAPDSNARDYDSLEEEEEEEEDEIDPREVRGDGGAVMVAANAQDEDRAVIENGGVVSGCYPRQCVLQVTVFVARIV